MSWTNPQDVKAQVQKLWDRGLLLGALVDADALTFPRKFVLRRPSPSEMSHCFADVRDWIGALSNGAKFYRIEWRSVNHRVLGANDIPVAVWIDTLDDALDLIGKRKAAEMFCSILALVRTLQPGLVSWLQKRPLRALELAEDWSRLLAIVAWVCAHPRPNVYLRQIDLPGVHTKFIEQHRGVLGELIDLVLPDANIDKRYSGVGGFCKRYGFREKPLRVRFRVLDASIRLLSAGAEQDVSLTAEAFALLNLAVDKVFITENEINFLAFPAVPRAMVLFGAGYGFENLAAVEWLQTKALYYWGDIDTHGFAILNQLRAIFPHVQSLLMHEQVLLDHRELWSVEPKQEHTVLVRLTDEERALYDLLRQNHWGKGVRLEQERIGFAYLCNALQTGKCI